MNTRSVSHPNPCKSKVPPTRGMTPTPRAKEHSTHSTHEKKKKNLFAGKLQGKELELRCPFPPPGLAVAGDDLDARTVEGVGLCPKGRLMVQFR